MIRFEVSGVCGGGQLGLYGANLKGGGAYKGNAMVIATFGSANNPVNGNYYLSNGLQLHPSSGAFVGLSGVLFMSRVNAGLPNAGIGFEFDAMTASIIGGTSFSGGVGTAMGTLVGAFIMGFLNNIMNLLGIQSYLQQIIKGGIFVAAVAYDIMSKNKKTASQLGNIEERGKEA